MLNRAMNRILKGRYGRHEPLQELLEASLSQISVCLPLVPGLQETYNLIGRPQSNDFHVTVVIADCVTLAQGVKGRHCAHVPLLVQRPPH
jgi:hypothetical protein